MNVKSFNRAVSAPETGALTSLAAARRRPMTQAERRRAAIMRELSEARRDALSATPTASANPMAFFLRNGWSAR